MMRAADRVPLIGLLFASWMLVSCGQGSTVTAGVGSGGTGNSATGPIIGFGSVVVNGVKFDDTGARITIGGIPDRAVSELQLGMVVEVYGDIRADGSAFAEDISATLAAQGPVDTVDASTGVISILGQRVRADAQTVLAGYASLGGIAAGDMIAVSGLRDAAAGQVAATRIERRPPLATGGTPISVQGPVAALTATSFRIGDLTVAYSPAALANLAPGGLANGLQVEVTAAAPPLGGPLTAASIRAVDEALPEGASVHYEGFVSGFVSTARFQVGTLTVNATGAIIAGGTPANLANGAKVQVEGTSSMGVVRATRIQLLAAVVPPVTVIEGTVTDFIALSNFQARGQRVDASAASFTGGTSADLANGRAVRLTGTVTGSVLAATSVEFTDTRPPEAERLALDGLVTDFASPSNFKVNGRVVSVASSTVYYGGTMGDIANGRRVSAEGVVMGGVLVAAAITIFPVEPAPVVTTQGLIANFVSPASFTVSGQAVSASSSTVYGTGSAAGLANGVTVTVTGTITAGVLRATRIDVKPRETPSSSEVTGYITNFVSVANFKVQGQVVDASTATFAHVTATKLANGLRVHVTGRITNGVLKATLIEGEAGD